MPAPTPRRLPSILATGLLLTIGLAWMALGILVAASAHPAENLSVPWDTLMASVSIIAGLVAVGLALSLSRAGRRGYRMTLVFLVLSAVAVVFDDLGWADLIFMAANASAIALLHLDRSAYSAV